MARGRIVLAGDVATWMLICDDRADVGAVDALARLHLATVRFGGAIGVADMCPDLAELLDLLGLLDLAGLRRQPGGESEHGEEIGVQEGVEGRDPVA